MSLQLCFKEGVEAGGTKRAAVSPQQRRKEGMVRAKIQWRSMCVVLRQTMQEPPLLAVK